MSAVTEALIFRRKWHKWALCTQVDIGDLFFPERGESPRDAKKVCTACPVRSQCLFEALIRREPYGVWGGLSTRERTLLIRWVSQNVEQDKQIDALAMIVAQVLRKEKQSVSV